MYSSYYLCPKCKTRRFNVTCNNEQIFIQIKKTGEIEIIKPEYLKAEDICINEISCLGCSWKETLKDINFKQI